MSTTYRFSGGTTGAWDIRGIAAVCGEGLPAAARLDIAPEGPSDGTAAWRLRAFVSNVRYATRAETTVLQAVQPALARPAARHAALIPIRKSADWWQLPQDERRAIFEEQSHHTQIGLDYLPAVARRLHHCRDLGEPFDFLTWFEYAPEDEPAFDDLLARLRATKEWRYVDREVDIRLARAVP
jgi:chlorite dismutase